MKPKVTITLIEKKAVAYAIEAIKLVMCLTTIRIEDCFVLWQCTLLFHILIF